jgi:very-short-patch-repair endonuclease
LKEGDLKRKVIQHFKDPMGGPPIAMSPEVLDLCESEFERDVGRTLIDRGYRIRVQVKVGAYRIDLVVEGAGDKRLAIECDGDRYHTIDKWAEDMNRQKMLERMGWIFWRVWGSHWRADKAGCITDLQNTLQRLGIEPLGATPPSYNWTKHEIIDLAARGEAEAPRPLSDPEPSAPPRSFDLSTAATRASTLSLKGDSELTNLRRPPSAIVVPSRAKHSTVHPEAATSPMEDIQSKGGDNRVRIGSSVVVRFAATNSVRKLTISEHVNNPKDGIVWAKSPLGEALMNASVDEEVEYEVNKKRFVAVVQRISQPSIELYDLPRLAPGAA